MARQTPLGRRTILQMLASLLTVGVGAQTVTATNNRLDSSRSQSDDHRDPTNDVNATESVSGLHSATVDRIVDGEHVVILIEAGGEVVEQLVFPRDEYPAVEEGDRLLVWVGNNDLTVLWRW